LTTTTRASTIVPMVRAALLFTLTTSLACAQSTSGERAGEAGVAPTAVPATGVPATDATDGPHATDATDAPDAPAPAPAAEPTPAPAGAPAPVGRPKPPPERPTPPAIQRALLDRVLIKLEDPGSYDEATWRALLEKRTGAKVARIRKGPLGLLQVTFVPVDPPRDDAAQRALVKALKGTAGVKYVEPERLMRAKD
jgi:hypothetical protein